MVEVFKALDIVISCAGLQSVATIPAIEVIIATFPHDPGEILSSNHEMPMGRVYLPFNSRREWPDPPQASYSASRYPHLRR